jgi:hypothetical protein
MLTADEDQFFNWLWPPEKMNHEERAWSGASSVSSF